MDFKERFLTALNHEELEGRLQPAATCICGLISSVTGVRHSGLSRSSLFSAAHFFTDLPIYIS